MNRIEFDGTITGEFVEGVMPDGKKVVNSMVSVPRSGRGVNRYRLTAKGELAEKVLSEMEKGMKIHVIGEPRAGYRRLKNTDEKIFVPTFGINAQEIEVRE